MDKTKLDRDLLKKIAVFFVVASIIGLVILAVVVLTGKKKGDDKIVIENPNPEVVQEISSQLVYETGSRVIEYYSPVADVVLKYSKDNFYVSEGFTGVSISPASNSTEVFGLLTVHQGEAAVENYIRKYKNYNEDFTVENEEDLGENKRRFDISWKQKNLLGEGQLDYAHTIIEYKKDNEIIILDITNNGKEDISKYIDKYINLLNTIVLHPEDVDQDAIVQVQGLGIKFDFDRKKWKVNLQTEESINISFLSDKYEENEELLYTSTSIYSTGYQIFSDEEPKKVLEDMMSKGFEGDKNFDEGKDFKLITKDGNKDIGGLEFQFYQYSIKNLDHRTIKTSYWGYNPGADRIVEITTIYPEGGSRGEEAVEEVLKSIEFGEANKPGSEEDTPEEETSQTIKGLDKELLAPINKVSAAETDTYEFDKAALLGKSAVVHIFNRSCVDITFDYGSGLSTTPGSTYEVCTAGFGSGFYVNNDGDIVTNAHVSTPNELDLAIHGTIAGYDADGLYSKLLYDTINLLVTSKPELFQGVDYTSPEFKTLMEDYMIGVMIYGYKEGYMTVSNPNYQNYIQTDQEFKIDKYTLDLTNKSSHYSASVTDYEEAFSYYKVMLEKDESKKGVENPDLALLKSTQAESNTALDFSDFDQLSVGQEIYVFGYPGVAENKTLFAAASSNIPTITKGAVSAVKPNATSKFDLVQIDASISHGNSGGPITNSSGEVVAVATYGISMDESADFNAGVSVEEVINMLNDNNVENEIGTVTQLVNDGLDDFSNAYYQWAIIDFQHAMEENGSTASVLEPLIDIAEEKIDNGEDNTPVYVIGDYNIHKKEAIIGVAILIFLVLGGFLLIIVALVSNARKNKKAVSVKQSVQPQQPQQQQPVQPQTTQPTQSKPSQTNQSANNS